MDNKTIVENMKSTLKAIRKKLPPKMTKCNHSEEDDDLSDLMTKNWQMKSPPEEASTIKISNAFEKLMKHAKSQQQQQQQAGSSLQSENPSPNEFEMNCTSTAKKKRGRGRPRKIVAEARANSESDLSILDESSLILSKKKLDDDTQQKGAAAAAAAQNIQKFFSIIKDDNELTSPLVNDEMKKRNRVIEWNTIEKPPKRRKIIREVLLDSNENSLDVKKSSDQEQSEEKYQSGRPKRSCSNKIDYSLLLSSPEKQTPEKKRESKIDDSVEIIEIDENSPLRIKHQKPIKLAPVFVKKVPKPLVNPLEIEARRNFLLSELPESIRASIDKQRKFEEEILMNDLIAYPTIAHIRQDDFLSDYCNDGMKLYSDSKIILKSSDEENDDEELFSNKILKYGMLTESHTADDDHSKRNGRIKRKPVENIKDAVRTIKEQCENFPTNRCFKQILSKLKYARNNDVEFENGVTYQNSLFIDIFKPTGYEDFLFGVSSVKCLKEFLTTWNEGNEYYDSDDSNSRQSLRALSNNFVVLSGKHGSGKTSSVYALCNDLNYEVIEINAGIRRNGKKIQEVLEATQSHRVVEKNFLGEDSNLETINCNDTNKKQTLILIEDAELIFENDDGFISSIQQLVNKSKRPVILTTNDQNCQHLQKFIQYSEKSEIIYDNPKNYVGKFLSLMCLATSSYEIDNVEIEHLYAGNNYDFRKTINEIEFFIRSDSASNNRDGGSSLSAFYRNTKNAKSIRKGQLAFYCHKDLSTAPRFISSIISLLSCAQRQAFMGDEISYHQHNLMNEIANYFERNNVSQMENEHDFAQKQRSIIKSSISSEILNTCNAGSRAKTLDFSPLLREICRSEKRREAASMRRIGRNHYLKYMLTNSSFSNDYFDRQTKIFENES